MEKTFKTYDGYEVPLGATVYMTGILPAPYATPNVFTIEQHDIDRTHEVPYVFFSTYEACQQFIDDINKPISKKDLQNRDALPVFGYGDKPVSAITVTPNADVHSAQSFGMPINTEINLHQILNDFATAYGIDINTVLQFILKEKAK